MILKDSFILNTTASNVIPWTILHKNINIDHFHLNLIMDNSDYRNHINFHCNWDRPHPMTHS